MPPGVDVPRSSSLFLLLLALLLPGCGFNVAGDAPMDPPPVYRTWWAQTEACSGLAGDFDRVEWLVVPGHSFPCSSGNCAGHWQPGHQIFLASDWTMNELVVRHEMLHDLLQHSGHPDPPFGHGCSLTWESWVGGPAPLEVSSVPGPVD